MTSKEFRQATRVCLLGKCGVVLVVACLSGPARADQSMTFAWVADTRGDANNNVIDTAVFTPIVNNILALSPAPSVVIFGGDAGYRGGTTILTQFQQVFTNRLTDAGIPTAYAIGNHEIYTTDANPLTQYALQRQQDFQSMFNLTWPQNGPAGYNNLAFSFQIGNSLFIVADSYYAPANGSTPVYGVDKAQRDWIAGLLQNDTASHIFVLTHVPAFSPWNPSPNPDMANFWTTITTAGSATNTNASILFAGHEHLYYRTLHDGTYQVLSGSGGAPLGCEAGDYCGGPAGPGPVQPGDVYALSYNYTVVSINGRYVNVNVFDQFNNSLDSFQFFDNSGVNNAVINNTTPVVGPQASGILASSGNTITNSAPLTGVNTGIDAVSQNSITNSAAITPAAGGNGIHVYDQNTIANTATGRITGNSPGFWGIWVNTGNTVVNQGVIAVAGSNSVGFLANGDNNSLTNQGTLAASGAAAYAVQFLGNGNSLLNTGYLAGNVAFAAGATNSFRNAAGALFEPGATVQLGAGNTFVNEGMLSPGGLGAVLSSGNGSSSFTGNFVQRSTGTYAVDLAFGPNRADRIDVSGTAVLSGQVAVAIDNPGTAKPQNGASLAILTAAGGVTDQGLTLAAQSLNGPPLTTAVFRPTLVDPPGVVYLNYTVDFAPTGLTANQTRVGRAVDAIQTAAVSDFQSTAANLFWAPTVAALGKAYDSLSGEGSTGAQQAVFDARDQFYDSVVKQATLLTDGNREPTAWRSWTAGFGSGGALAGQGSARTNFYNGGGAGGIDYLIRPDILLGIAAGGSQAGFSAPSLDTNGVATGFNLGLYGVATSDGGVYAQGLLSYGSYNNDIHRDLVGGTIGPAETAHGRFSSSLFGGHFEAGWKQSFGQFNLTPFAGMQFDAMWQNAYAESSTVNGAGGPGSLGLRYNANYVTSAPASLGLRVDTSVEAGNGVVVTPSARLAWVHEFTPARTVDAAFLVAPGFGFTVNGAPAARDAARVDAGVSARFSPQLILYANFVGLFSGDGNSIGGFGALKYSF